MKRFLAIFIGTAAARVNSGWDALDPAQRKQREENGIRAWGQWMTDHAAAVLEHGGPLGRTKRVAAAGITDIRNDMAGYVVVQAESHDAAARLFEQHPHFTIFPGDSVEIMECLPIPGRPQG